MQKIVQDTHRVEKLQHDRDKIMNDRKRLRAEVETKKAELVANFDKIKKGGNMESS